MYHIILANGNYGSMTQDGEYFVASRIEHATRWSREDANIAACGWTGCRVVRCD